MVVQLLIWYVSIQWICSIVLSYSVQTNCYELSQVKKMRRISYMCLLIISLLFIFGYFECYPKSLWMFLILPITVGLIIISIIFSTLTFLFVFNTTHELKTGNNDIMRNVALFILPLGLLTLKVKREYEKNEDSISV